MNLSALTKIPLFFSVDESEMGHMFAELKIVETTFRKGEILAIQDEPANRLIILLTGSVKAEMTDASGHMAKVEDIEAPSPLAILFLFGQENRFPVQVIALEDVTAVVIPRQSVLRMLSMNETILKNYLDISADFATRLSRKLNMMSLHTIRQKIAAYLLGLAKKQGSDTIVLDRSKSALAEYFGVARPSLERELTRMRQEGLLSAHGRSITLTDKTMLIRFIE